MSQGRSAIWNCTGVTAIERHESRDVRRSKGRTLIVGLRCPRCGSNKFAIASAWRKKQQVMLSADVILSSIIAIRGTVPLRIKSSYSHHLPKPGREIEFTPLPVASGGD